jgi:hypothetical protein
MDYELPAPASGAIRRAILGPVRFRFDAGRHTPRSEQDEAALEHLVRVGLATRKPGRRKPALKPPEAAPVEPVQAEEE